MGLVASALKQWFGGNQCFGNSPQLWLVSLLPEGSRGEWFGLRILFCPEMKEESTMGRALTDSYLEGRLSWKLDTEAKVTLLFHLEGVFLIRGEV